MGQNEGFLLSSSSSRGGGGRTPAANGNIIDGCSGEGGREPGSIQRFGCSKVAKDGPTSQGIAGGGGPTRPSGETSGIGKPQEGGGRTSAANGQFIGSSGEGGRKSCSSEEIENTNAENAGCQLSKEGGYKGGEASATRGAGQSQHGDKNRSPLGEGSRQPAAGRRSWRG